MIFENKLTYIRERKPFFGTLPLTIDYTWDEHMKLQDTHPEELLDVNKEKLRIGLNSFHLRPSAPWFAKTIDDEMRKVFHQHKNKITNIAFCGFGCDNKSYPLHKDSMDVFFVQVINDVKFVLNEREVKLNPGDYVWIPRGTYHQIIPNKSRVSFSFGVEGGVDPSTYV